MGAAGTSTSTGTSVENVFSTFLYQGTSANQTINNGIDLAGEGGLVWVKGRPNASYSHGLYDTERGVNKRLASNETSAESTHANSVTAFNNNGFSLGSDGNGEANVSISTYVSWTFRKAPKFFDIVEFDSNSGSHGKTTHSHNLGVNPGLIIIKQKESGNWYAFHQNFSNNSSTSFRNYITLNGNSAQANAGSEIISANTTQFTYQSYMTEHSQAHVAYLFAHNNNDGGFGPNEDQDIIKCGATQLDGSGYATVDVGFEPQWVLVKSYEYAQDWRIYDVMRGITSVSGTTYSAQELKPNENSAEATATDYVIATNSTGFSLSATGLAGSSTDGHIYMAIRKPNVATITDATKVFKAYELTGGTTNTTTAIDFPPDIILHSNSSGGRYLLTRRLGSFNDGLNTGINAGSKRNWFETNQPNAFDSGGYGIYYKMNNTSMTGSSGNYGGSSIDNISSYHWKSAKSFLDVVSYTGTGSAKTEAHGLGVAPEMMWVKNRGVADPWAVYYGDNTDYLVLNTDAATVDSANWWNDTSPTSSVFTIGTDHSVNASGEFYIAYLFATLAGVSKVGTVSHSGSSTDVNCGFSNGARLVILKRTDSAGLWYLFDSVNGIVSGNDPYYATNETGTYGGVAHAAHITNTDFIDPLSSGFQISGNFTDGDYLFYAVA